MPHDCIAAVVTRPNGEVTGLAVGRLCVILTTPIRIMIMVPMT